MVTLITRTTLAIIIAAVVIASVHCQKINDPGCRTYQGNGITTVDIQGDWFAGTEELRYVNKNGYQIWIFPNDSMYYNKQYNQTSPALYHEEYGIYSLGGLWNEMISCKPIQSYSIVQGADLTLDTIAEKNSDLSTIPATDYGFRKIQTTLMRYSVKGYRTECGYEISDLYSLSRLDSNATGIKIWERIPRPINW